MALLADTPNALLRIRYSVSQPVLVEVLLGTPAGVFEARTDYKTADPRADFNGQNGINVTDIFDYLVAWFGGC